MLNAPAASVECRIFRDPGATTEEVHRARGWLVPYDRLDRKRPYVGWRHTVTTPTVFVDSDGRRYVGKPAKRDRVSDVHRTAYPGRCLMADQYSPRASLEYLDALPFPHPDLDTNREQVCDYCFYGGPTRTAALVP